MQSSPMGGYSLDVPLTTPFAAVGTHNICTSFTSKHYIYFPAGVKVAEIQAVASNADALRDQEKFYNPSGTEVSVTRNGYNTYVLDTTSSAETGGLWSFKHIYLRSSSRMKLLGIPEVIGFAPESMLVPSLATPSSP